MIAALSDCGLVVAAESQVLARFDFSSGLNADAVESGLSAVLEATDYRNGFKGQQMMVQVGWQSDGRLVTASSAILNKRLRTAVIALKEPVSVKTGQGVCFPIDLNSGVMDSNHILGPLTVNGTVQPGGSGGRIILSA